MAKKSRNLTVDDVRCEAEEDEDDVTMPFDKVKHVSDKAVLLRADGSDTWIPFSQLVAFDAEGKEAIITAWIAQEKGLI